MSSYQLASHLHEWKVVHTHAQELFFSVLSIEPQLSIKLPTEENIPILVESWYSGCESTALLAQRRFIKFDWISNKIIDDYCSFMISDNNVLACMMKMNPGDILTLHNTKNAIILLKGLLMELLRIADFYISDIAKNIKERK